MIFRLSLQQNQLLTKNFKKMRRTILTLVAVATLGLFMISCGGSGVGKSGISNKYLGKYPGLMADKAKQKEEIREAYRYAESRSDVVKITKKEDKFKEEWKAAIEKELTSLIGKEIPTEVKDFPVKVSKNATIKALSANKEYLIAEVELEFTKDATVKRQSEVYPDWAAYFHYVDNNGQDCRIAEGFTIFPSDLWGTGWGAGNKPVTKKAGDKIVYELNINIFPKDAEKWANFEKIVINKTRK